MLGREVPVSLVGERGAGQQCLSVGHLARPRAMGPSTMSSSSYGWVALMLLLLQSSCQFYTSCPAGGSNGSAGAGNSGGSGNQAGSSNLGGGAPLLDGEWENATSNLADMASECGNLSYGSAKPDEDLLIVSVARHGLWGSTNGGDKWNPIGTGSGGDLITNRASSLLFDPEHPETFWESGIYNGNGVFKTTDDGKTFVAADITHNDFVSVDFSDARRKTLLASGHEQAHKLYLSTDSGVTWQEIGDNIPDEAHVCPFPYVVDAQTFLLGCGSYGGGKTGIYRSTNAGASWTLVSEAGGGSAPLVAKNETIYWASEGTAGMTVSKDKGKTWSAPVGAGVITGAQPWELPDGRLAELSMASVVISDDGGVTWSPGSAALPYRPTGFFYSSQQKAFYVYHYTCDPGDNPVAADAVMRFSFDYETQ